MKETKIIMGMPITVDVRETDGAEDAIRMVYDYFTYVDKKFSTYKEDSEISKINKKKITEHEFSEEMKEVLRLSNTTKDQTRGFFDITRADGTMDPSGLVKGWAIFQAANLLRKRGVHEFYIEAGGDIQTSSTDSTDQTWRVGIRNPFNINEIVKILEIKNGGVATSGTYVRGQHIYNPHDRSKPFTDIASLTVLGPNIYEADRFATAAFAMGRDGITFIENLTGFEAYQIDHAGIATMTSGFNAYVAQ